jgi:hypothetical protein
MDDLETPSRQTTNSRVFRAERLVTGISVVRSPSPGTKRRDGRQVEIKWCQEILALDCWLYLPSGLLLPGSVLRCALGLLLSLCGNRSVPATLRPPARITSQWCEDILQNQEKICHGCLKESYRCVCYGLLKASPNSTWYFPKCTNCCLATLQVLL